MRGQWLSQPQLPDESLECDETAGEIPITVNSQKNCSRLYALCFLSSDVKKLKVPKIAMACGSILAQESEIELVSR